MSHQNETPPGGGALLEITDPKSGLSATVVRECKLGEATLNNMLLIAFNDNDKVYAMQPKDALEFARRVLKAARKLSQRRVPKV
jgi:hypothetical protein